LGQEGKIYRKERIEHKIKRAGFETRPYFATFAFFAVKKLPAPV
jgi:hypothetical protein